MRRMIVIAAVALAAGCGGASKPAANVVEIQSDEYAFVMPKKVEGGWTTMRLTNTGGEPHEFALVRLEDGKTLADVEQLLSDPAAQEREPPSWAKIRAGLPTVGPGETAALTEELEPGRYALICFLDGPNGRPHFMDGMISELEVAGVAGAGAPKADATLELGKGLTAPRLEAGARTLELRNDAGAASGVFMVSYAPGKTAKDLNAWMESGMKGQAPGGLHGGAIDVPPHSIVYLTYTFETGVEYALFDDVNEIEKRFSVE
jgi:hypothetical protein